MAWYTYKGYEIAGKAISVTYCRPDYPAGIKSVSGVLSVSGELQPCDEDYLKMTGGLDIGEFKLPALIRVGNKWVKADGVESVERIV